MMIRRATILILALSAASLAGCDAGKPSLATVHGKVTYKGEPLKAGNVLFLPVVKSEDGLDHPSAGVLKEDGTYELTTFVPGDGAAVGEHKVSVIALEGGPAGAAELYDGSEVKETKVNGKRITMKSLVPDKYKSPETTPLTKKVEPGDNTIDLKLED